ncbi:MAG: RNA polymerase sigma factor [Actinomycetota bacterium]
MDEANLKRLIRATARGDEESAGQLFDHFHPRVYRYALSKLWDQGAAEDVASETFARVLRDLDRFKWRGAGFEAWLFRIASNLITDHVRSRQRELPRADTAEYADTTELRTPEWATIAGETTRQLNGLLSVLPHDQREVLVLRFAGGLETHEIGAVMGRKPNAVRQLQHRALEQLRGRMRDGAEL